MEERDFIVAERFLRYVRTKHNGPEAALLGSGMFRDDSDVGAVLTIAPAHLMKRKLAESPLNVSVAPPKPQQPPASSPLRERKHAPTDSKQAALPRRPPFNLSNTALSPLKQLAPSLAGNGASSQSSTSQSPARGKLDASAAASAAATLATSRNSFSTPMRHGGRAGALHAPQAHASRPMTSPVTTRELQTLSSSPARASHDAVPLTARGSLTNSLNLPPFSHAVRGKTLTRGHRNMPPLNHDDEREEAGTTADGRRRITIDLSQCDNASRDIGSRYS